MKKTLLTATALLVAASYQTAAMAETTNWTGFYAGGQIGAAGQDMTWTNKAQWGSYFAGWGEQKYSQNTSGIIGGLHFGYLHQWDAFVAGIDLTGNLSDLSKESLSPFYPELGDTLETNMRGQVAATLKLGYAFDRFLPYVEGGYAVTQIGMTNRDRYYCEQPGTCLFKDTEWAGGYVLGAGLDYMLTDNLSLGLNYRYANVEDVTFSGPVTPLTDQDEKYSASSDIHAVTLRASWHFN
ncbi:outer membrane protein [Roseibium sp. RKSG952]|uniref:outer membrane protein n=1 Tax=Roseibium sp. RKSG952 TaxID=2529384 RepID=UPI0012BB5054|nr:outer membrane beta-barrel protein [Roseibium sp. RKSG952]MTH97281.1 porin family protein [Roseibium sp. RKSG952]